MEHLNKNKVNPKQGFYYGDAPQEYDVMYHPFKGGTYVITINDAIEHVSQFQTAVMCLNAAKEEDEVEIHLSCCPGGLVDGGDVFIHAMRKCKAPIRIIASGGNHSMATQILLEADEFELSNGFNALIHAGSGGSYGTMPEYKKQAEFDHSFRAERFREAYEGFLTDDEITQVLEGRDIWLDAQAWCDRAVNRMKYYHNKIEEMDKAAQKASRKPRVKKPQAKKISDKSVDDTSKNPVE